MTPQSSRRPLASRVSRLALAGLLLAGWSVAAISVSTAAHASVRAEDPNTVDAPADTPATGDSTKSPSNSNSSTSKTPALDEPGSDGPSSDASPADGGTTPDGVPGEPTDAASENATDESTSEPDPMSSEDASTQETPAAATVGLHIAGAVGAQAAGSSITVSATGLKPLSRAELWVFSTPRSLGEAYADESGSLSMTATLPADLGAGTHSVVFEAVDAAGNPVESATQVVINADGSIASVTENASADGLDVPVISADPHVPGYAVINPLDDPGFVAKEAVTALTLVTVAGIGLGAAARVSGGAGRSGSGDSGPSGGGLDTAVRGRADDLDDVDAASFKRGARVGIAFASVSGSLPRFSPLLGRIVNDAAPLRAFVGILSLALPLASLILGILAASSVGGLAEPAAAAFMLPLMVIGVFDALAGLIGAVSFAAVVAISGGLVSASSVRSVIGVGLIIAGPGLIASSFRDIRRRRTAGSAAAWERLTDLVVVPLIGAWTTIAIVKSLPDLGGVAFPIADQATLFGLVALIALVAKVLAEEAAARWVPARMRALTPTDPREPGTAQQLISALVRTGVFLFVAAAFVGNVWQLWVAALLFLLPGLLALIAHVFPNSPRLWQILPEGMPLFAVMLVIGLIVTASVKGIHGESAQFAQLSFMWMAVPGFLLALLGLTAREPREGDVRWYTRPAMTAVYRVGGVVVLVISVALALRG